MEQITKFIKGFGFNLITGYFCGAVVALTIGYFTAPQTYKSNKAVEALTIETNQNKIVNQKKDSIIHYVVNRYSVSEKKNYVLLIENYKLRKGVDFWINKSILLSKPRKPNNQDAKDLDKWIEERNSKL